MSPSKLNLVCMIFILTTWSLSVDVSGEFRQVKFERVKGLQILSPVIDLRSVPSSTSCMVECMSNGACDAVHVIDLLDGTYQCELKALPMMLFSTAEEENAQFWRAITEDTCKQIF